VFEYVVRSGRITDDRKRSVGLSETKSEKLSVGVCEALAGEPGDALQ